MRYRKIHILGAAGSGKSYAAARVGEKYGLPVFDLDDLFWDNRAGGYGVMAPPEERDEALEKIIERDAWIVEGSYCRWVLRSFEEAEIVIVLTTPRWLQEWRIIRRFVLRKLGRLPSKKKETLLGLFRLLKWNHRYERDHLPFARMLMEAAGRTPVECKTLDEVFRALESGPKEEEG